MNDPKEPSEFTEDGAVSGYIADAVANVMKEQAEKEAARDEILLPLDQPPSAVPWIVLGVLSILSLYLWFGSPSFLATGVPEPLPPTLVEAGLRMEVYHQALKVNGFYQRERRLPNSLAEAGDPYSNVAYQRLDPRSYRLWIAGTEGSIEFASTDSLSLFLGNAPQVIGGGG